MKDLLGREVQIGNYICYALTVGRSANLAVYQVKEVLDDKIKAVKISQSYRNSFDNIPYMTVTGESILGKYCKWSNKLQGMIEMTQEEKFKVDNKISTLSMPERIFILDGFSPELFSKE